MAALKRKLRAAGLAVLEASTRSAAHAVFAQRRWVGVLILAALASSPRCLVLGLCALAGTELCVRALGLQNPFVPYGYNALLCGVALGRDYLQSPQTCVFASALGAGSALVSAALAALAAHVGYLPVLSLPFVLSLWFVSGFASSLPLTAASPQLDVWATWLPALPALALQSLGAFVLLPSVQAGVCVLCALCLHSRIATLLATSTVLLLLSLLRVADAPLATTTLQLIACSGGLTAAAIGGVWLVPSAGATLLALGAALLSAFFAVGLMTPLARLGLAYDFAPFQLAVLCVLSALRQRSSTQAPHLAKIAAETPELLLLNDAPEAVAASALRLRLPFAGAWCCTQGVDGAYTHRGVLRHAYDFELNGGPDGALCAGSGRHVEDYHCFGQPVLAVADGSVIAIENGLPNNPVGEEDSQRPWGNYVVLQHSAGVYSVVAHLGPGTVVVYPGQFIWRGQVLGYCGSSGRSPRPHLHFQLQTTPALGSPTLASCFHDVVVQRDGARFAQSHRPEPGDALQNLQPDYALAAQFQFPLGLTLTYALADRHERIVCELDAWGRSMLRSLDRSAELLFSCSESRFSCSELRGAHDSVLTLLRLSLSEVPLQRYPNLTFDSAVPARWFGGRLRRLCWDLKAPFVGAQRIALQSRFAVEARGIAILGRSLACATNGGPAIETRAVFGSAPGPQLLEVSAFGRVQRAELVAPAPERKRLPSEAGVRAPAQLAIGAGGWS